jgi:serine/threonine protein kinase
MSFQVGQIVGDYRIVAIAGVGGMGEVYQTEHVITRRWEAMKVLSDRRSGEQADRFLREIQVQASLNHPNIAAVHTAFRIGSDLALVMELLDGTSLARLLKTVRVAPATRMKYVDQVLSALEYAHDNGVIHCDVSPANIIVTRHGEIKLTDFGLAKRMSDTSVSQGAFAGSPHYMSPEQTKGDDYADARSDIYSTGAVLYELVTGRTMFQSDSVFELMSAQVREEPAPPIHLVPTIPRGLNDIIMKALNKDPAYRFQSAGEFQTALRSGPWGERAAAVAQSGRSPARGRLRQLLIGFSTAVAVTTVGLWWDLQSSAKPAPRRSIIHAGPITPPQKRGQPDWKPLQDSTEIAARSILNTRPQIIRANSKSSKPVVQPSITEYRGAEHRQAEHREAEHREAEHREIAPESPNIPQGGSGPNIAAKTDEIAPEIPPLPKQQQGKFRRVIGKIFHPLKTSGSSATEKLDGEKLRNP